MRRMFSEKQLEEMIKSIGKEIDFQDVDLKVKTIEQSESNWSQEITEFPNSTDPSTTSEVIYCRANRINGELHIVMLGKITNPTASDISIYGTLSIAIDLPKEIAEKIYDVQGKKASETSSGLIRISATHAVAFRNNETGYNMSNSSDRVLMFLVNGTLANRIYISFGSPSPITLATGKDTYFEGRVSLDLL